MFSYMYWNNSIETKMKQKGIDAPALHIKRKISDLRKKVRTYKKASSCFFLQCLHIKYDASMTVEAAFVLPLCLFAIVNVLSITEIYRLQSNMNAAMHTTAKDMAIYAYGYGQIKDNEGMNRTESVALTHLYAARKVESILGREYLAQSPIAGGTTGINWSQSELMQPDCIDLIATYEVAPAIGLMGFEKFPVYNRVRMRAWTGYDNAGAATGDMKEQIVYITPDGEVYHESGKCPYLKLSIHAVDIEAVEDLRNENKEKFYPCEDCGREDSSTVFVTDYGNRYHTTLRCSGLKRTVYAVPISQAGGRCACSKCGS